MHESVNGNVETVRHFGKETNDITKLKKKKADIQLMKLKILF